MICTPHQISFALSSQERDAWSMHYVWETGDVYTRLWWQDLRERGHLEDLGIDGRITATCGPVFRYFMPLGPRKFCPPTPICSYSVMCKQKQHKKLTKDKTLQNQMHGLRWQPISNSLSSFQRQQRHNEKTRSRCGTNIVFSIDLP